MCHSSKMAACASRFCRLSFSISARISARETLINQSYANTSPLLINARLLGAYTKECCCASPPRCWKCDADLRCHAEYFCPSCEVIQPPEEDVTYFEIMNSPAVFNIDTAELTKIYRELQMKLHPDRFSQSPQEEQNLSALQSSAVNRAYTTLLKPLCRGLYLLRLEGLTIEEKDTSSPNPAFLLEIMEINEKLEDASMKDDLRKIENENKTNLERCTKEVAEAFDKGDYLTAKESLAQLRYYTNISDQIKNRKVLLDLAGEY